MGVALVGQSQAIGLIDPSFGFPVAGYAVAGNERRLHTGAHRQLTRTPVPRIVTTQIRGVRKPV
jgi:hypothetical protein